MAQNSKIGVMKANQSFCCGFCFEGRSRDELSMISDFLSGFRRKFIRHVTLVSSDKKLYVNKFGAFEANSNEILR